MTASTLTPRQASFVAHYIETNGNGTLAVQRAGYNANEQSRAAIASKLLKDSRIQQAINELRATHQPPDKAEVLAYFADVMRDDEADMRLRIRAAELLGKCVGLFRNEDEDEAETRSMRIYLPDNGRIGPNRKKIS